MESLEHPEFPDPQVAGKWRADGAEEPKCCRWHHMESQEERRSGVEQALSERYAAPFRQKRLSSRAE